MPRFSAPDDADDARSGHAAVLDAQSVQFPLDQRLRSRLFEAQFGIPVDFAAEFDDARAHVVLRNDDGHALDVGEPVLMLPPDVALVQLINRTASAYTANPPAYITYRERTHVTSSIGRTQEINRFVEVRQADDYAIMQDLPQGAQRIGQAFPIIPYFDPLGQRFTFGWFANLKRVDITLQRDAVGFWPIPPADPTVDMVVPYASFWQPAYLPDSTPQRLHLRISPTPAYGRGYYIYEVLEDAQTRLPQHIELRSTDSEDRIALDYKVLDGHWVITQGTMTTAQRVGPLSFSVTSQTDYDQIAFPATAPDPRLAGTPAPSAS